jgi:peptide-methionine (R)-S-oxide reductase
MIAAALPIGAAPAKGVKKVRIAEFDAKGVRTGVSEVDKVVKTEAEWKAQLTPEQFYVTRKEGTERAFTGKYARSKDDGVFRCVCCNTALFDSKTKYESGTGWPSYYQPIAKENVHEKTDMSLGMQRVAVECARCDAHLGHVFPDGPRPTGLRYCMNSASLVLAPRV